MINPWQQLSPKDPFLVALAGPITNLDQEILTVLYQPIIGPTAFSLFMSFYTEVANSSDQAHLHTEILNTLSIGLPQFYQARIRLEGIGLLKTFVRRQTEPKLVCYQLQSPISAADFFQDDLLSLLLLEMVGEKRFNKLVARYALANPISEDYTEITRSFLDVYSFHPERLKSNESVLGKAHNEVNYHKGSAPQISPELSSFDWTYFLETLNTLVIKQDYVQNELKSTILSLHELYGIDELEMQEFLLRAVDLDTGKVNSARLRQLVQRTYREHQQKVQPIPDVAGQAIEEQKQKTSLREATLKLAGFNRQEIQIIAASETQPPMVFAENIKKQKGGYLSEDERWTLQKLQQQSGLPKAVLNILLHYILFVQGNPSLNAKYANTIANDWLQSNIHTPEAAMQKVKELSRPKTAPARKTPSGKAKRTGTIRKETLPKWVQQLPDDSAALSPEEEAYFKEQIQHLTERRKQEGGED